MASLAPKRPYVALLGLALSAGSVFHHTALRTPLAIAALLPLAQSPEGMAAVPLMLRGRYDIRGGFLGLSMAHSAFARHSRSLRFELLAFPSGL